MIEQHDPLKYRGFSGRVNTSWCPGGTRRVTLVLKAFNKLGKEISSFEILSIYCLRQGTSHEVPIYKIGLYYKIAVNFLFLHTPNMSENVWHTEIPL